MPSTIYALVDCNNFFVSCERVFNPKLHKRPVVVLSNNDGCVVSRSNEAKSLGIAMGEPIFKIRALVRKHNVTVLSSNFALYGDLSARVMSIIMQNMPEVAIYSIDEAFIDLSTLQANFNVTKLCATLVQNVEQCTGIPISVGIAASKTLAKVANHIAKRGNVTHRVFNLNSVQKTTATLDKFKVGDIWGIGRRLEARLHALGIYTAGELIRIPANVINSAFNINVQRTVLELQGISCIELRDNTANKQQIMVSRSFGHRVTVLEHLQEALVTHASSAAEKLRAQGSATNGLYVFLHTGLHGADETIYKNSLYMPLAAPTTDTRTIINYAKRGLQQLFKAGYRYQKVGIILCDLKDITNMQMDIFAHANFSAQQHIMQVIDDINQRLGRNTLQFAAAGLAKTWRTQVGNRSSSYTTSWQGLPTAFM